MNNEKLAQHLHNINWRVSEVAQHAKRAKRDFDKYADLRKLKSSMINIRLFLDGIDHEIAERAKTLVEE